MSEESVSRSEVQAMIDAAMAERDIRSGSDGGEKIRSISGAQFPTGYFRTLDQMLNAKTPPIHLSKEARELAKEIHEKAVEKFSKTKGTTEGGQPSAPVAAAEKPDHLGGGQAPLGGSRPAGEVAAEREVVGGGDRVRVFSGGQGPLGGAAGSRSKEAAERAAKKETQEKPVQIETGISDEVAGIVSNIIAALLREFLTRGEAEGMLSGIPAEIRTMGSASITHPGKYLKLEGNDSRTAVWGNIDPDDVWTLGGAGGLAYDYVYVGGKRFAVPEKTSNYLKVYLDGTTAPEWVSAMPETPDSNAEVFDVTKNRIHVPANFAGG